MGPVIFRTSVFLAAVITTSIAQQTREPADRQAQTAATMPSRDVQAEDAVAKLFNRIRANAKLNHLGRIHDRKDLQALTCSAAATGKVPVSKSGFPVLGNGNLGATFKNTPSALYTTQKPTESGPELERIAQLFQKRSGFTRYAVAVWRNESQQPPEYWVAIDFYDSAGTEFFLNHFTDQMEWKNEWKDSVTPQCRKIE